MKTLIKNGTIVTATEKFVGDVLIDGESTDDRFGSVARTSLIDLDADNIGDLIIGARGVEVHSALPLAESDSTHRVAYQPRMR